jgi:hypothetical protein
MGRYWRGLPPHLCHPLYEGLKQPEVELLEDMAEYMKDYAVNRDRVTATMSTVIGRMRAETEAARSGRSA